MADRPPLYWPHCSPLFLPHSPTLNLAIKPWLSLGKFDGPLAKFGRHTCRMQKFLLVPAVLVTCFFVGCSGTPNRPERGSEPRAALLPAMTGEDTFADGKLLVEASLSQGSRPFGGRGPGGGRREGRRHGGGDYGGGFSGGGGGNRERSGGGEDDDRREETQQPRLHESTMPPVVLQLRATNKGTEPIDITWVECNSALGNFGVLPEKMSLPAGETADTEHMTSLLGISGDEVPVTVTLRVHGKQEKKTFVLHPTAPEAKS